MNVAREENIISHAIKKTIYLFTYFFRFLALVCVISKEVACSLIVHSDANSANYADYEILNMNSYTTHTEENDWICIIILESSRFCDHSMDLSIVQSFRFYVLLSNIVGTVHSLNEGM